MQIIHIVCCLRHSATSSVYLHISDGPLARVSDRYTPRVASLVIGIMVLVQNGRYTPEQSVNTPRFALDIQLARMGSVDVLVAA